MTHIEQLENIISSHRQIAIISHFNPDGDAIGSTLAIHHLIKSLGKNSTPILPSPYPSYLSFAEGEQEIIIFEGNEDKVAKCLESADLIFCVDFNKFSRTEGMAPLIKAASGAKVLIDHHIGPDLEEFDLAFSEPSASSTCELIFWILMKSKFALGNTSMFPSEA